MTVPNDAAEPEVSAEAEFLDAEGSMVGPDEVEEGTSGGVPSEAAPPTVEAELAERTADLQRVQADYQNYRKRVERDRTLARTAGEASVLRSLLTVLDDIGRAAEHGELTGGFKAVADSFQSAVKSHRLEAFGEKGDVFDPRLHEALFHAGESVDVDQTTVEAVVRVGYRIGDEVLRHAQVGVVDPAESAVQDTSAGPRKREVPPAESGTAEPPAGEATGEADDE